MGCHFLLQGVLLTQGWNPGLLHCRPSLALQAVSCIAGRFFYQLSHIYLNLISQCCNFFLFKMEMIIPILQSCHKASVQSLSHVRLFVTPWAAARQASLSITNSRNLLRLMSIEPVMPSNYLVLCRPLLLLPSIFPSIRVFSNESVLCIRWPKYWSFSLSISSFQ